MKLSLLPLSALVLGSASFIAVVAACTDSDRVIGEVSADAATDGNDPGVDATRPAISDDADAAIADARVDADADAAPPTCTVDGICHTVLPTSLSLRAVFADGSGIAWAVSDEGKILRWDGHSWSIAHDAGGPLYAMWGSGPTDLWAGGANGLHHGTGANSASITWTAVATGSTLPVLSIWGSGPDDIWAVGGRIAQTDTEDESLVLHYTGSANGWAVEPDALRAATFWTVWGSGSDVWIGGGTRIGPQLGVLVRRNPGSASPDGGPTWTDLPSPAAQTSIISAGFSLGGGRHWVAGRFGRQRVTSAWAAALPEAEEVTWTEQPSLGMTLGGAEYHSIWASSPNDVWIVGNMGRVRRWDGASWTYPHLTVTALPMMDTFRAVGGSGPNDVWIVGENVALHKGP